MNQNEVSLEDYVKENGQAGLSRSLGVSQVAIHRALKMKRKIFIKWDGERIEAFEIRPFPHAPKKIKKIKQKPVRNTGNLKTSEKEIKK